MEIIYAENPLASIIKLNEHEREILWHKIRYEELTWIMFSAHHHLTYDGSIDQARAIKELDPDYYLPENDKRSELDERVDELMEYYMSALEEMHGGDCTCDPCSCSKCHVEKLLGIDTLKPFPGKHILHKIGSAFSYMDGDVHKQCSLNEVMERLKNYPETLKVKNEAWKNYSQADWDAHVPRWTAEAKLAYEYMSNYINTRLKGIKS